MGNKVSLLMIDKKTVNKSVFVLIFIGLASCANQRVKMRSPSSIESKSICGQGIEAFFDSRIRDELALINESTLIEKGILNAGEIDSYRYDPVYKDIVLSEDESLRDETAKVIALIRRYRPDIESGELKSFYHKLFHSCKL